MIRHVIRLVQAGAVLILGTVVQGCGGGDDSGTPPAVPAPTPSASVTLGATNYQGAARVAMRTGQSAFSHASMGVSMVDNLLNRPLSFFPTPCPQSGTFTMELTDQNSDTSLDPGDTLHIRWNQCNAMGTTSNGLARVELVEAIQIPGGREYQLRVFMINLELSSDRPGAVPVTINFSAPIHHVRTATSARTEIQGAEFRSGQIVGDIGTAELYMDYLQDYATQTFSLSIRGKASSNNLGGQVEFTTPLPFTGVLGEYPSAGRLTLTGGASSSALLSEEGTAANDNAAVFAAVDANGDGTLDASEAALGWATIVPVQLFGPFPSQVVTVVMP